MPAVMTVKRIWEDGRKTEVDVNLAAISFFATHVVKTKGKEEYKEDKDKTVLAMNNGVVLLVEKPVTAIRQAMNTAR